MKSSTKPIKTTPLSAYEIAKQLGRSRTSVLEKIKQLDLKPIVSLKHANYYAPECVTLIGNSMRQPNK